MEWNRFRLNGKRMLSKEFWRKDRLLILLLTGILFLVIAVPDGEETATKEEPEDAPVSGISENVKTEDEYVRRLEIRLAQILSEMDGAGRYR